MKKKKFFVKLKSSSFNFVFWFSSVEESKAFVDGLVYSSINKTHVDLTVSNTETAKIPSKVLSKTTIISGRKLSYGEWLKSIRGNK